ncbi:MAG: hypothetical protein RBS39_12230 [Phycisphaerales bacterium]|nr:hypothetical protein [Phycisphaerales bacterium]
MLFTGHTEATIDAKQRLAIPAKYRSLWDAARDGTAWQCVPWPGGIIRLFTENRFAQLAEMREQSLTPGADEAELDADLFGLAERLETDAQGRVRLPIAHLELTGLLRTPASGGSIEPVEVVVVGARNRLEIRSRSLWLDGLKERFARLPELVDRVERASREGA